MKKSTRRQTSKYKDRERLIALTKAPGDEIWPNGRDSHPAHGLGIYIEINVRSRTYFLEAYRRRKHVGTGRRRNLRRTAASAPAANARKKTAALEGRLQPGQALLESGAGEISAPHVSQHELVARNTMKPTISRFHSIGSAASMAACFAAAASDGRFTPGRSVSRALPRIPPRSPAKCCRTPSRPWRSRCR